MSRALPSPSRSGSLSRRPSCDLLHPLDALARDMQAASPITALNIEFVAKPGEAHRVQASLPAAIHGAFGEVAGFAGGFVLIANDEARLVTVVTLWTGEDRLERSSENLQWVRALLEPYLDRCLRTQSLSAYLPRPVLAMTQAGQTGLASTRISGAEEIATCAA